MVEVVCGVLEDKKGRILACLRGVQRPVGGKWEFPGGKVDPGEVHEIALARELKEELGIEVKVGRKFESETEWSEGDVSIRLTGYRCEILFGKVMALEHEEIRWCEREELKMLDIAGADIPLLQELLKEE